MLSPRSAAVIVAALSNNKGAELTIATDTKKGL